MNINLGIAPIAWSNDDMPELGGDTPIETCLFEVKSVGYSGIELGGKFPIEVATSLLISARATKARNRLASALFFAPEGICIVSVGASS